MIRQKLRKVGNSYVVTIPKEEVERLAIEEGQLVEIQVTPLEVRRIMSPQIRAAFERSWARSERAYRYLIDRGIRGSFVVAGPFERRPGVGRVYRNPDLQPSDFVPRLRVLSFDVETSLDGRRLYSVAVAGAGGDHVFLVGSAAVPEVETFADERRCLARFLAHVRAADPDVLTGWNVADFETYTRHLSTVASDRNVRRWNEYAHAWRLDYRETLLVPSTWCVTHPEWTGLRPATKRKKR